MNLENNYLLRSLPAGEIRSGLFRRVELKPGQVLAEPLEQVGRVYFPYTGVISFLIPLKGGHQVQTGIVGKDGAVGALQALDGKIIHSKIIVRVPGTAAVIDPSRLSELTQSSLVLRSLLLRHEQFFLAEVQQSAACNAVHTVTQRMCRWLLRMNDLVGIHVPVTQELLAQMIGVQRTSVTAAATSLQDAGVIGYSRGNIGILDIDRLRQSSCECYDVVKNHYERFVSSAAANSQAS